MAATDPGVTSHADAHRTTPTESPETTDLLRVVESDTETVTGAVAAGRVSLADLDAFVLRADRGEIDGGDDVDAVIRIVRTLLSDAAPRWEEMEPAGRSTGS